jgi:pimeloyl-ACP methyl ester carboxylesterase
MRPLDIRKRGVSGDSRGWHAAFHGARDIAELLVQGRERLYLREMFAPRIFDPSAIAEADFDVYVRAYEAPGAMRAGFELYRSFQEDAEMFKSQLTESGKLAVPTLVIGGQISGLTSMMDEMAREIAKQPQTAIAPRCGHWVPEENPTFVADAIAKFIAC